MRKTTMQWGSETLYKTLPDSVPFPLDSPAAAPSPYALECLLELSPDAIFITDSEGLIRSANSRSAELFGYTSAELSGKPIDSLIPKQFRSRHPSHRKGYTAQPKTRSMGAALNLFGLRKDGTEFPVDIMLRPIETASGPGAMSFVRDMTEQRAAHEIAQRYDQQFRSVVENVSDYAIYLLDPKGRVKTWNSGGERIKGYTEQEVVGQHISRFFSDEDLDRDRPAALLREAAANGRAEDEGWRVRKDGSRFWADSILTAIRGVGSDIVGYSAVTRDITDRKIAAEAVLSHLSDELQANSEALRSSEARYRTVFNTSPDAVVISRMIDGVIVEVNQAFHDVTGYERSETIGRTTDQLRLWALARDRLKMVGALRDNTVCRDLEFRFRRKSNEVFWARMSVSRIEIDGVQCFLSFARDISEAKLAEEKIVGLAFFDPLTGLANRRLLFERLTRSLAATNRGRRKRALLFIDLDDFKTLNDTLGHHIGDLMLQEVGHRLIKCTRETDTVGRLGGDEFVVMLEDLSETSETAAAQAKAVAEKILAAIALPYRLADHECRSGSSIGISVFGESEMGMNEILQQADIAMYQSKAAGRNTIRFFAPELQAAVNARASAEDELRQAIQKNQFVLYYQPQVNDRKLIGAEALLRWNHPRRGIVPPDEFIPMAERTGLIVDLGNWVLESACAQIAAWASNRQTCHIVISINISVRQIRHPGFVEQVLATLSHTGANPHNLRLELTESMFVESFEEISAKMTALKAHGLRFSVDDFGTGYSSLAYLKRLPIDALKIDRAFVHDIVSDGGSRAIAESIILMSRALGLSVIAEGVETEEQREFLHGLGCSSFQGWLFSHPLPIAEFQALC